VLVGNGRLEEARKVLEAALAAPGVRTPLSPAQRERLARGGLAPSDHERASVFLLLAEVHSKLWDARHPAAPAPAAGAGAGAAAAQQAAAQGCPQAQKVGGWGAAVHLRLGCFCTVCGRSSGPERTP
jgi:hypothetical protein